MNNPNLLDVVAAFRAQETARLAAERAVAEARRQNAEAITAECRLELDALLAEAAPAFEELAGMNSRHAIVKHVRDATGQSWWTRWEHRVVLTVSVAKDADGLEFLGWNRGKSTSARYAPTVFHEPDCRTRDRIEFKLWLAQWLGRRLALA